MPKLSPAELKALLAAEKADALSAMAASKLSDDRARALDYYLGDMSRDLPAPEGRSKAVSTDVADTVEGLMPQLMDIFTSGDEVVRFEPVGPEDVAAAEQETDYVNHVFMQQNPGFLVLYSFIKDALLSKVGIVKVWWEEREEWQRETYYDLDDAAFAILAADPAVDIVAHSERAGDGASPLAPSPLVGEGSRALPPAEMGEGASPSPDRASGESSLPSPARGEGAATGVTLHDVTVETRRIYQCARVEGVPPEEFGISRHAKCIRDADYCFHEVVRSEARLVEQGYDAEQVEKLPSWSASQTIEQTARDTVEESAQRGDALNKASRLIRVTEHYIRMAYNGDEARLYRVTTGGDDSEVLNRGGEPDVVEVDVIPFAAMTPVIVTHRFFGRSIADLVMDIQRIKTALLRALLDNAYLANNPRTEVAESHATETTLDDLLVSRPGGIVRTKMPGGLNVIVHPDIGSHVFPLLQYQDATREWRTGVSRQGQGVDPNALQNQVATIANQMFNAAQAKMKLIARIFAETGIRDLFSLLHGVIRKHGGKAETVRLRNQWVAVDPREWRSRSDMTINVGLGTGGKSEQLAHLMSLISLQKEALAAGKSNLVSDQNLYNSATELTKLVGLKNVERFFTDPRTQAPPRPGPDPMQIELQIRGEIEKAQAQADIATQQRKVESEMALAQQKFALERELKLLDAKLKADEHQRKLIAEAARTAEAPLAWGEARAAAAGEGAPDAPNGSAAMSPNAALIAGMMEMMQRLSAPKRARKLPDGSWVTEAVQ